MRSWTDLVHARRGELDGAVREDEALALRATAQQHGGLAPRLAHADGLDFGLHITHRVGDGIGLGFEADRPAILGLRAFRVDVDVHGLLGAVVLQPEELRDHELRDGGYQRHANEGDARVEQQRRQVGRSLRWRPGRPAASSATNHDGGATHGGGVVRLGGDSLRKLGLRELILHACKRPSARFSLRRSRAGRPPSAPRPSHSAEKGARRRQARGGGCVAARTAAARTFAWGLVIFKAEAAGAADECASRSAGQQATAAITSEARAVGSKPRGRGRKRNHGARRLPARVAVSGAAGGV
eukprot:scaffold7195_cov417-Prasinococcus_capsulatus_cf.AAC.8